MNKNNSIAKAMRLLQSRSGSPQPMADGGLPTLQYRGPDGKIAEAATEDELGRLYDSSGNLIGHNSKFENERYGAWDNPEGQSTLGWLGTKAYDIGQGAYSGLANLVGAVTPFGTSAEGNMAFQVPPMIPAVGKAFGNLMGTPSDPGTMYSLTGVPELDKPIQDDTNTAVLSMFGGNAFNPLTVAPKGSVGMFAGRAAKTANHAALARAEEMASKGIPREQIWNDTGWFQGPDKQWRFEIDDSNFNLSKSLKDFEEGKSSPLGGVLNHPDLYGAYPDLADIPFSISQAYGPGEGALGSFLKDGTQSPVIIAGFDPKRVGQSELGLTSSLPHEVQHVLQQREGFSPGASPDRGHKVDDVKLAAQTAYERELLDADKDAALMRELDLDVPKWMLEKKPWDELTPREQLAHYDRGRNYLYRNAAGEVEARAVEARAGLFPEERQARPPWLDYDVPEADQIVKLLSDTGKPNILGSAIATAGELRPFAESSNPSVRAAQRRAEDVPFEDKLVVQHNMRERSFLHNRGNYNDNIPVPSLAISKASEPLTNFGEVSLFGSPEMAIPKGSNPVYPGDAYTARAPKIVRDVPKAADRDRLYEKLTGEKGKGYKLDLDDPYWDDGFRIGYLRSIGQEPPPGVNPGDWARNAIGPDARDGMERFVSDWLSSHQGVIRERIDKGWSNDGERRLYAPHTLDNMVKASKGKNASEGFNYGPTSWKAAIMRPFQSLRDIQDSRGLIGKVPEKELDAQKSALADDGYKLAEALGYRDTDPDMIWEGLRSQDPDIRQQAQALRSALLELPTEYFEAKPQRAVDIGEFKMAGVPEGMDDVAEHLKRRGLDVRTLPKGETERAAALTEMLRSRPDLLFSDTGKPSILGSALATAGEPKAAAPIRAYHGTSEPIARFDSSIRGETTGAESAKNAFWFSKSPDLASDYAVLAGHGPLATAQRQLKFFEDKARRGEVLTPEEATSARKLYADVEAYTREAPDNPMQGANVLPVDLEFRNPLVHDYQGAPYRDESYSSLVNRAAEGGYDGVVLKNTYDPAFPQNGRALTDIYGAITPNTVRSATTGETLFSDTGKPSILGSAMAGAGESKPISIRKADEGKNWGVYHARVGDDIAGYADYGVLPNAGVVRGVAVDPAFQRQGVASALHGRIQDDIGLPLTPDNTLSQEGYDFWKASYPEAVRDHRPNGTGYWIDDVNRDMSKGVPAWRMSGGPNRPDDVLWADNRPSLLGSALATAGETPAAQGIKPFSDSTPKSGGGVKPFESGQQFDFTPGSGSRDVKIGNTEITYGVSKGGPGEGPSAELILAKTPKDKRGQGSARAAISQMLSEADANGARVFLNADPMDKGVSKAKLDGFYESLGFKKNKGKNKDFSSKAEYVRYPKK